MNDEIERLNRLLDDLAAERDPQDRKALGPEEASLAEAAAFLKTAAPDRGAPDERFLARLEAELGSLHHAAALQEDAAPAPAPAAERPGSHLSRRRLIAQAAAAIAGAAAGAGGAELVSDRQQHAAADAAYSRGHADGYQRAVTEAFSVPMAPTDRGQWMSTELNAAEIPAGKAVRFRVGAVEGFVINPGDGKALYALSAVCTHMGCMLSWLDQAGTLICPCHGAQYQADGTVLSGIARHPLPRLTVRLVHGAVEVWSVPQDLENPPLLTYTKN